MLRVAVYPVSYAIIPHRPAFMRGCLGEAVGQGISDDGAEGIAPPEGIRPSRSGMREQA